MISAPRRYLARWAVGVLVLAVGAVLLVPAVSSGRTDARYAVGAADDNTTPFNLVSMPALIAHRYRGHGFRLEHLQAQNRYMRRWEISYRGDGLRLTGTLSVPRTHRAHPLVVDTHGWIRPMIYRTGAGLQREEARLTRLGFAVLHPDYRNYGDSAYASTKPAHQPLGYPADVLNAIVALKRARLRGIDLHRMALFGRSMGGGVALQVAEARPTWFKALVMYSAVSSSATENWSRWVRSDRTLRQRVARAYGTPTSNPTFWAEASSRNYVSRLGRMPVILNHGTADHMCPEYWSLETYGALRKAGVPARLYTYKGEHHRFTADWPEFMHRVDGFLLQHA
ncbi:alpha/beta fold hydrolase [Nocardioides mangrovicus]|uniref:Alpha/beta fold hydrolase n=1 Tax=Nocardioides mangrovicus TaxID=2478913 RepID=A0A3L8P358_9ACTN|nr:alpha/beta fold hydrolase [Nocardioides mangrovicus]RLV49019.1 alpha/beta fold hydrolase [Nocardioides mangrovicus]